MIKITKRLFYYCSRERFQIMRAPSSIISRIIYAVYHPKRTLQAMYLQKLGLGYVKRKVTAGPIKGLWLVAGKRIFYSKDFWNGSYEMDTCHFIQSTVPANAVCYDIGANIGYHTLIMAKNSGSGGLVYAFEPIPEVCEVLTHNAKINNMSNIVVVNNVVSCESGTLTLVQNIDIDQAGLLEDLPEEKLSAKITKNPLRKTFTCTSITIDEFVAQGNKPPSFMKIDVEGTEVEVLKGATDTLKNHQPIVLCETHGKPQASGVYKILAELKYDLFCVSQKTVPIESITQVPTNMYEGHVFACPKKQEGKIRI